MGTTKATGNRRSRDPGEIWITLLATTVEKKGHYSGNSDCPTQSKLKEDVEAFRKINHDKSSN